MTSKQMCLLQILGLELHVNLGWPEKERQQQQVVVMNLTIYFSEPPKACTTDNLNDTLCYSDLVDTIREKISNKNFHLLEHLSQEIYGIIKSQISEDTRINLNITKHPTISGLSGGINFSYFDAH